MAAVSGATHISNISVHGLRDSVMIQDLSTNIATLLNYFPTNSTDANVADERARKRRKLDNGTSLALQPTEDFDASKSVVLAKFALDFHFPTPSKQDIEQFSISEESRSPSIVSLEAYTRNDAETFKITLWTADPSTAGVDLIATTTPDVLDSIAPHIEAAASLTTTKNGSKRSNKTGTSFSRSILIPPTGEQKRFRLETEIRWLIGVPVIPGPRILVQRELRLLSTYFPDKSRERNIAWSLSDFYDSVHVPPSDLRVSSRIQESLTETTLYPFQQRAVDWLLRREGVEFSADGDLVSTQKYATSTPPASFEASRDANGDPCHVSRVRGMIVSDLGSLYNSTLSLRGGILSEEMGLGKTVELIALISHHKRQLPAEDVYDTYTGTTVRPSGATLIISPPSILEQWINEINAHAPELRVLHYKGIPPASAPKREHATATVEYLMRFDVVVTTYNILSKEIHFATPPPDRSLRHAKHYERRRSPLVEISWWRVCLDEAQMVESGVSQAATVARVIPRCNAWAVSGTPLRKDIQDLRGLLIFLRYEPFSSSKALWHRLDKPSFREIFGQIALRHNKDRIRDELRLPPQKRVVITVPFTAIEEQNYSEMIRQMCDACWLSPEGIPLDEERGADHPEVIDRMREWLVRLRQTCLHAHVGRKNRRALGAKNGALRTVDEVLEVMIDQNDNALKSLAREVILLQIQQGHVKANAKDIENRSESALPYYEQALKEAQDYVKTCRNELHMEKQKLGSASASTTIPEHSDSDDDEDKLGENMGRIPVIRKSLRSFLEVEHASMFFIGTVYFQIKSNENLTIPESDDFHRLEKLEVEWYDKAKAVRRELLRESQSRAQREMNKIKSKQPFQQISKIEDLPDLGGIESRKVLDMMDNIIDVLNAQADQIQEWRTKIVNILLMPLVDEDEGKETTGDEYEDSTKVQDELYVYIMALRTLVADRNTAVHGLQDILVEHELTAAEKQARTKEGHAPELVLEIVNIRRKLKGKAEGASLKGVVSAVRSLITSLQFKGGDSRDNRATAELSIIQKYFSRIQGIASEQAKILTELEKEQEMFRGTMNQRLEFYRQLQHVSDTVAPWKEDLDDTLDVREFTRYGETRDKQEKKLAGLRTKHAYLTNLRRENQQEDLKHECIICQDEFEIGVLTTCGHKYCKACINQWWHAHRTCPLCKNKLRSCDFRDINFKPSAMKAQEETNDVGGLSPPATPSSSGASNTSIYSDISDSTMKEIKMIDLDGSYGTKIDMIARHLIWIRNNDPGAKTIIFSQFGDFLEVLKGAFRKWKIGSTSISDKNGIHNFRTDPAIECFLLDAKSDSSGLNLVNATYVFLCEPLINPAIELQAIARVHRIGQQRPTTIFMYLVSDTVEEAIYDISVTRRLEHMGRGSNAGSRSGTATPALQEKTIDAANSMEMEAAPLKQLLRKKGDGEIVQADDLWRCLFGKPRKEHKAVLDKEVGRHLRAEAAERRMADAMGSSIGDAAS